MRIAVVLWGHFRSFESVRSSWIHALEGMDVDFYLYTWDTQDSCTASWHKGYSTDSPQLSNEQIQLLRIWDESAVVDVQSWTEEERKDSYPYIVGYWIRSLLHCIDRIRKSRTTYDTIICGRFDVDVSGICFSKHRAVKGTIALGYHPNMSVYQGALVCDVLYAFHPEDINQLENVCTYAMTKRWKRTQFYAEHEFYDAISTYFDTVEFPWVLGRDFKIKRIDGSVVFPVPVNRIIYGCTILGIIVVIRLFVNLCRSRCARP
jgi:hypothetical protein